jgi:hypothetical protein
MQTGWNRTLFLGGSDDRPLDQFSLAGVAWDEGVLSHALQSDLMSRIKDLTERNLS